MANICDLCGKGRLVGNKISHSNIKTKITQKPNLQKVRAAIGQSTKRLRVCTRCLRTGTVTKKVASSSV